MPLEKPDQYELRVIGRLLKEFDGIDNPSKSIIGQKFWFLLAAIGLLILGFIFHRTNLVNAYWQGALCFLAGICAAYAGILSHSSATLKIIQPYIDLEALQERKDSLTTSSTSEN